MIDAGRRPVLGFGVGGGHDAIAVDVPFCEGDTLLMFSDGLVERRRAVIDEGIARLADIVVELGGLPVQQLCDQIVVRMREYTGTDDDVVLLVVRRSSSASRLV